MLAKKSKPGVDLTDHVKECMTTPEGADMIPHRKALREKRKEEVRVLYNTKSVPTKEQRDKARQVISNVYHQELVACEKESGTVGSSAVSAPVPVVYKLLAHDYGHTRNGETVPVALRSKWNTQTAEPLRPATATQTYVSTGDEISNPPQRVDPKLEDILAASRHVRQAGSRGAATVDRSSGREVRSVAVGSNPSEIIQATMRRTSRPVSAGATSPKPAWQSTHRTAQTNTDLSGWSASRALGTLSAAEIAKAPPKMGLATLAFQGVTQLPADHAPGSRTGARHAHRPRDTMFIF